MWFHSIKNYKLSLGNNTADQKSHGECNSIEYFSAPQFGITAQFHVESGRKIYQRQGTPPRFDIWGYCCLERLPGTGVKVLKE